MGSCSPPEEHPRPAADGQAARRRWVLIWLFSALFLASLFWSFSPPGLLGKADAVAFAFCDRWELRSFRLEDRPLPFCARCTGTFLGALTGLTELVLFGRGQAARWPARTPRIILGVLTLLWAVDGVNSFLASFPALPHLYPPSNALRLFSGLGFGMALAAFYLPALAQLLWREPRNAPSLDRGPEVIVYLAAVPGLGLLVLSGNPLALYPLALASGLGALLLLAGIYAVAMAALSRRENRARQWSDVMPLLVSGGTLALLQILVVDAVRLFLFGTWGGFPGLA